MDQEANGRAEASAQSQSLYRKYRPRSFAPEELVGQEAIARTLRNAIALDRVAHAYLFCGPRGTGKTTTARLLAKAVNCLDPDPANRPCNVCAACQAINAGAAVDIIEIDAASNRGVDDIRDLRDKVKYAPTALRVRFYIIDEAHQLTRDAFNAFLKTLEEPPGHVKFVLATTEPDKLPDTVASRCQRFDFHRFPVSVAVEHMRRVCALEGLEVEDEALRLIARQSTGSMRDALGLLDQLALFCDSPEGRRPISADDVRRVVGLSRGDRLVALVGALARRDVAAGLKTIAEATENGEDVHQLNRQLVAYLRTLLLIRAGGSPDETTPEALDQAQRFSLAELAALVRTFSGIEGALNRSSFAQLPLEIALVESIVGTGAEAGLGDFADQPTPAPAAASRPAENPRAEYRPEPPRHRAAPEPSTRSRPPASVSAAAPAPAATAVPPAPPAGPDLERLVAIWTQIRRDVKAANSRIAALLGSVDPVAIRGDEVVLVSPYEFHRNKLNEEGARRVVEDSVARHLGAGFRITCVAPEEARFAASATVVETSVPSAATPSAANGNGAAPAPEPDPPAPVEDDDDEVRLRAARAIFAAEEVDPR
ncbi:MAG TPA: DNA polymerase III subunit gamma/tau [Thermomicrobiaceae bacterium]|nr:DNA polymerase III subunit gamma/tau [Thermomicrobiaceae bacterium]